MAERVRDLNDRDLKQLVGCSRDELDTFCRRADILQQLNGAALPLGLYALLPAILDADVEEVRARAARLQRAPRGMAWQALPA